TINTPRPPPVLQVRVIFFNEHVFAVSRQSFIQPGGKRLIAANSRIPPLMGNFMRRYHCQERRRVARVAREPVPADKYQTAELHAVREITFDNRQPPERIRPEQV